MNFKKFVAFYVQLWILIVLLVMVSLILCHKESEAIIQLDMSHEHDKLKFLPEDGDRVCAVILKQNDEKQIFLTDDDQDWIYTTRINKFIEPKKQGSDTIYLRFKIVTNNRRLMENAGEERIGVRTIIINQSDLLPVYIFNENCNNSNIIFVKFCVNVASQKVLGFFKPENGDRIIISGDFCKWDENGLTMTDEDKDDNYYVTVPFQQIIGKKIFYKFRILSKRNSLLPNKGWELESNIFEIDALNDSLEINVSAFNNIERVIRFVLDVRKVKNIREFKQSDTISLKIRFLLDGQESYSDRLIQVNEYIFETAVVIPPGVQNIQWQLVQNKDDFLTEMYNETIDLNGKVISL